MDGLSPHEPTEPNATRGTKALHVLIQGPMLKILGPLLLWGQDMGEEFTDK